MRRFHNMEFASLPKTGAVTQGVIKGHVKIHSTTVDFVSICYVCKTSAVHSNDFSNRQQLSQAENALLIFDYYQLYIQEVISSTSDLNFGRRITLKVDLIDILKHEHTSTILFCLGHALLTCQGGSSTQRMFATWYLHLVVINPTWQIILTTITI